MQISFNFPDPQKLPTIKKLKDLLKNLGLELLQIDHEEQGETLHYRVPDGQFYIETENGTVIDALSIYWDYHRTDPHRITLDIDENDQCIYIDNLPIN